MKPWLRPLPFALVAGYAITRAGRAPLQDAAATPSAALCDALAHASVRCSPEDVVWVDPPGGVIRATTGRLRALVRGREVAPSQKAQSGAPSDENDTFDLFMVGTRLSPEGQLLDVNDVHNLTRTSGADEGRPIIDGNFAAYAVAVEGRPEAIHVLHLEGHGKPAYEELSRFQRFQTGVTDWQQTGQSRGVARTVYTLVPPPTQVALTVRNGILDVHADARRITIDAAHDSVTDGSAYVRVTLDAVTKPPTFAPWMSDRLRAATWFGDEKNQVLKVIAFTTMEWLKGVRTKMTGDTGERDAQDDLKALRQDTAVATPSTAFQDPETGWPPKSLEPPLTPPLAGEGQWVSLEKDAFITPIPGLPTPFVTTFVRSDPSARQTRVYVTLWDPRLVALHMEAGTVEPVSATGEAGPGQIPRAPEILGRVVAGFNGGFQATHGQFGMQSNGVLYLPPKPYAATVMELRDGTTAFGAWPPSGDVPEDVLSFRQNMTPLVQNDKFNPWGRAWWGGVPPGWHDAIHTARSGLCLTKENFVAYFWGNDIGPEPLGRAMLAARCSFGIHLDMNPGLVGFEFYNVQPTSNFQPLGRPLQPDWEYEGSLKDLPDFKFRSRRMIKSMGHMLFPRYIHRDARDFFYLTARPALPGLSLVEEPKVEPHVEGEHGTWRVKGLPQHGYPYALATTTLKLGSMADDKTVRILRIDPRTVHAEANETGDAMLVASFTHASPSRVDSNAPSRARLWMSGHVFSVDRIPPNGGTAIATLVAPGEPGATSARGAAGISDNDGILQWIELAPGNKADPQTAEKLLKLLESLGCSSRGLVVGDTRALLGGSLDLGGQAASTGPAAARLVRATAPGARALFESTEVVPPSVWSPLQQQRVKWRPTLAPPDKPAPSSTPGPTPASSN